MQKDPTSTGSTHIPRFRLETHAQVEQRIGRSRATLCAMRDPKDRRYDPTFPKPIPVGPPSNPYASIRFDANEIDEWIKSRMDMRPDKKIKPGRTNATNCPPTEIPGAHPPHHPEFLRASGP